MNPNRTARYYYLRFLRLKGDPATLARGVAVGLYVGVTPTLPLHTILILLIAPLLRGNLVAALIAATVVSNPLTLVPQYYLSWFAGNLLLPGRLSWERIRATLELLLSDPGFRESIAAVSQLSRDAVLVMVLGGGLLAVPVAVSGYFLSFRLFEKIRAKRREKHILR